MKKFVLRNVKDDKLLVRPVKMLQAEFVFLTFLKPDFLQELGFLDELFVRPVKMPKKPSLSF